MEKVIVSDKDILKIWKWDTPATHYPLNKIGNAEITRNNIQSCIYYMYGVGGYPFFQVVNPVPITYLTIHKQVWMQDDPLNWAGMQILAKKSKGRVLVGGLGLGLIIHALTENPDVKNITVAEINNDVIELIEPLIPSDKITRIFNKDVFDMDRAYDTIILDIWAGYPEDKENKIQFTYNRLRRQTKAKIYVWGAFNADINPAIDRSAQKIFNNYMIRLMDKSRKA